MAMRIVAKSIRPSQVDTATWSRACQLDWWVKERKQWLGRIRGADGRQRWIKAADFARPRKADSIVSLP